jgi:hypothetical protein
MRAGKNSKKDEGTRSAHTVLAGKCKVRDQLEGVENIKRKVKSKVVPVLN